MPYSIQAAVTSFCFNLEGAPLMYGGDLNGIEASWNTMLYFKRIADEELEQRFLEMERKAYDVISDKYKCGAFALSGKLQKEQGSTPESSMELIRRLKEVETLYYEFKITEN